MNTVTLLAHPGNHKTAHTKIDKIKMDIYVIFLILIGCTEMVSVISKPFILTNELNLAFKRFCIKIPNIAHTMWIIYLIKDFIRVSRV